MTRRAFRLGNTSSSTVSAILAVFTTRLPISTPIPTSSRTPTGRRINTSQPALERNVRQENVERTQILPQPFALIPLLAPPITPARRPTGPARTLLRSPLSRSPQDKIDALVETRGGLAGSRGIEVISGGVAWDRGKFAVGSEGAGLGQSAGEDCAEGDLVGVAVLAGRAGDFGQGAVWGGVAAGGEDFLDGEEGGDVAVVEADGGLLLCVSGLVCVDYMGFSYSFVLWG